MDQESDFITNFAGQVLYTDDYYMSKSLMEMMYSHYKSFVFGTISMTKKNCGRLSTCISSAQWSSNEEGELGMDAMGSKKDC